MPSLTDRLFFKHIAQTSLKPVAINMVNANGIYLFDQNNKKYTDLISGVSVSNAGHNNPEVNNAAKKQLDSYTHLMVYGELILAPQVEFAAYLSSLLPEPLNKVYFVNSGSEAIEGAMKLAKRFTGRTEIISCYNAYHGSSQGSLSILGSEQMKQSFRPLLPGIKFIEFNNIKDLNLISENTAAVVVEIIQGEAGVILPQQEFLTTLAQRCKFHKTLLIVDEVQTGMFRSGKAFAFEHYSVTPDILVLAKALGGGFPLGAFISSHDIMQCLTHNPVLGHITTFGGHPVSCAAGMASAKFIQPMAGNIEQKATLFYNQLISNKKVRQIRYKGLLMAVELENSENLFKFIDIALEKGILTDWFLFCDKAFRISPPLIITEEEIKECCTVLNECLDLL